MRKTLSAFTIVELILVISIIGILSTIGVVSYNSIKISSEALQKETKTKTITEAIEKYYEKNGAYPSCADLTQSPNIVTDEVLTGLDPGVLTVPGEPEGTNSIACTNTPTLSQYGYSSDGGSFSLFYLKDENSSNVTTINNKQRYSKVEFSYNGSYQEYTVPSDINLLQIEAWGAQGGGDTGGKGGFVSAYIPVTPGEILKIYIGGRGVTGTCAGNACMPGGFNGGGNGGGSDISSTGHGGGGATDVRKSPYGLSNRIVVAGGGGASGGVMYDGVGAGGSGGGEIGQDGYACGNCFGSPTGGAGKGATQISGGAGGSAGAYTNTNTIYPGASGQSGSFGQGGNGTPCWWSGSGGGGGGYYGGGGGGCPGQHGGGGGSSWVTPGAVDIKYTTGIKTGNGQVIIYT